MELKDKFVVFEDLYQELYNLIDDYITVYGIRPDEKFDDFTFKRNSNEILLFFIDKEYETSLLTTTIKLSDLENFAKIGRV